MIPPFPSGLCLCLLTLPSPRDPSLPTRILSSPIFPSFIFTPFTHHGPTPLSPASTPPIPVPRRPGIQFPALPVRPPSTIAASHVGFQTYLFYLYFNILNEIEYIDIYIYIDVDPQLTVAEQQWLPQIQQETRVTLLQELVQALREYRGCGEAIRKVSS